MSELLHFTEHTLQEVALGIMALVYLTRLYWLTRFKPGKDRQPATGVPGTTMRRGILYSWANIAMRLIVESPPTEYVCRSRSIVFGA